MSSEAVRVRFERAVGAGVTDESRGAGVAAVEVGERVV